jgi:hypothetical protein
MYRLRDSDGFDYILQSNGELFCSKELITEIQYDSSKIVHSWLNTLYNTIDQNPLHLYYTRIASMQYALSTAISRSMHTALMDLHTTSDSPSRAISASATSESDRLITSKLNVDSLIIIHVLIHFSVRCDIEAHDSCVYS